MSEEAIMMFSLRFLTLCSLTVIAYHPSDGKAEIRKSLSRLCTSSKGSFSTNCPINWNKIDWLGDSISIVNFPFSQRDEGVIIKKDGAQIIISKIRLRGLSFKQWVKEDNVGTNLSPDGPTRLLGRRSGCDDVIYANVKVEQGIGTPEVDRQIYCRRNDFIFKFQARYWANDPKSDTYKRVLWAMLQHLKVEGRSRGNS